MHCVLVSLALIAGASAQSVKSCGGPNDHLKNPVIKLTPDPPVKGGTLTIQASGTLDEAQDTFTYNVDLSLQALRFVHSSVKGDVPMTISPAIVKGPFQLTVGPFSIPSSIPGSVSYKGQIHVVNGKSEPIMCIDIDMSVSGAEQEELQAVPEVEVKNNLTAMTDLPDVSSCGKSTDHIPDLNIANSGGVITMSGTLDESVTKATIDYDVSVKVLFISVPLKMTIPLDMSEGLISKGPIKATVGPSSIVVSPNMGATVKGTMKISDDKNQEIECLNVNGVMAGTQNDMVIV